jgi:hypothetical protein
MQASSATSKRKPVGVIVVLLLLTALAAGG